jgi:hypothetical protein
LPAVRDEVEPREAREARRAAERMGRPELFLKMDLEEEVFIVERLVRAERLIRASATESRDALQEEFDRGLSPPTECQDAAKKDEEGTRRLRNASCAHGIVRHNLLRGQGRVVNCKFINASVEEAAAIPGADLEVAVAVVEGAGVIDAVVRDGHAVHVGDGVTGVLSHDEVKPGRSVRHESPRIGIGIALTVDGVLKVSATFDIPV